MEILEDEIYSEILEAYRVKVGITSGSFHEEFVYREIIKLMRLLDDKLDKEQLLDVITNSLILIVQLFLTDKNDDDNDEHAIKQRDYLRSTFRAALKTAI